MMLKAAAANPPGEAVSVSYIQCVHVSCVNMTYWDRSPIGCCTPDKPCAITLYHNTVEPHIFPRVLVRLAKHAAW